MSRTRAFLFFGLLAVVSAGRVFGATSVETRIGAGQIFEGESIVYEVRVKNAKGLDAPDTTELKKDFDVVEFGPHQESSFKIVINGQDMTQEGDETISYRYQLTPKKTGALTVPSPFVTVDGKKVVGRPIALQVIAAEKQDLVLIEVSTSKQRVFPNQPFDVNLKLLIKPMPNDDRDPLSLIRPPQLKITWKDVPAGLKTRGDLGDWLGKFAVGSDRGLAIEGVTDPFGRSAILSLNTGREKRKGLDGNEINYHVYELKRNFVPQQYGTFEFGPVSIKGEFVDGVNMAQRRYTTHVLVANASARSVTVAPPEQHPANFNGCYGKYAFRASVNAKDLRVGDPVTLKLEFERSANAGLLENVAAPDLSANAKLTADFTIVDKSPPGQTKDNTKSYSFVVRPKKTGVSIPPVTVSIFDFDTEKFVELASEPIALNVTEAPQLRADEVVSGAPLSAGRAIGGSEKGVFQNVVNPAEISRTVPNSTAYMLAVVGLWLAYGLGFGALAFHRKRAGDEVLQRRLRARAEASAQLDAARAALKTNNASGAALGVHRALTGLIGTWNGVSPAGMTSADAAAALEKYGVSAESRLETVRLLDSIEAAKYGSMAGMQAAALVESASKLIPKIQSEMESK